MNDQVDQVAVQSEAVPAGTAAEAAKKQEAEATEVGPEVAA